jgi:RimJ/RimL family protein N-acetyltransferase
MPETKDLILRKAVLSDWQSMYRNIWSRPESAKYMVWDVTASEEEAVARMERTIAFQSARDYHWTVVEKSSGQAIGWAGMQQRSPGVWSETGIAIGPDFTGKGYGKQLLQFLTDYARDELEATEFTACCRPENIPSQRMQLACGFTYTHSETVLHPRDHVPYTVAHYKKDL